VHPLLGARRTPLTLFADVLRQERELLDQRDDAAHADAGDLPEDVHSFSGLTFARRSASGTQLPPPSHGASCVVMSSGTGGLCGTHIPAPSPHSGIVASISSPRFGLSTPHPSRRT
jgi:hypothetical protein